MRGNDTLKSIYAQEYSINVKPKVVAEWNANVFANPYIWGHVYSGDEKKYALTITGSGVTSPSANTYRLPYAKNTTASYSGTITPTENSTSLYAYRLSFTCKSNIENIQFNISAEAKDSSGRIIAESSAQSDKLFTAYSSQESSYILDLFSYDPNQTIASIKYTVSAYNSFSDTVINLDIQSPTVYIINQAEAVQSTYVDLKSVFSPNRPGDPYMQTDIGNGNVSPYHIAYYNAVNSPLSTARNLLPAHNSAFKYYLYRFGGDKCPLTNGIFVKYKKSFKANKVVIKVNSVKNKPSSLSLKTLNSDGTWSTGTTISSPFDSKGLCVLYYVDNAWTKTAWAAEPKYSNITLPSNKELYGIKAEFTSIASSTTSSNEVHLVEISPRLELDLSDYVKTFSISQELSNDSLPLPIGISNSNTTSVVFDNLPSQDSPYTQPFDDITSPLAGLIKKDASIRIITQTNNNGTYIDTQISSSIVSSWVSEGLESSTLESFDKMKILSTIPVPIYYQKYANPIKIISTLLDSVGFTDYNYSDLDALSSKVSNNIKHFWTVKGRSVLDCIQDILMAYQIAMYVDSYGVLRFKHISNLISSQAVSGYMITDVPSGSILPNISSFNIENENAPSNISVEYTNVSPYAYAPIDQYSGIEFEELQEVTSVFESESGGNTLGFIKLAEPLTESSASIKYKFNADTSAISSYSGYVLVGSEIIGYDGKEITFVVRSKTNGTITDTTYSHIVKSYAEREIIKSNYYLSPNVIAVMVYEFKPVGVGQDPIGTLSNLSRGCFGTPVKAHPSSISISDFTVKSEYKDGSTMKIKAASGMISDGGTALNISTEKDDAIHRTHALYAPSNSTKLTNDHRIFFGSFTLPDLYTMPTDGTKVEFGLSIGFDDSSSLSNNIQVGGRILATMNSTTKLVTRQLEVVVRRFVNGVRVYGRAFTLEDAKEGLAINADAYLNPSGQNTICAVFNPAVIKKDAVTTSNFEALTIILNGNVLTLGGADKASVQIEENAGKYMKFDLPALKILNTGDAAITMDGKRFGAYTNGTTGIKVNYLSSYKMSGNMKDPASTNSNLSLLASIINGNALGVSNKNELESVIRKRKVADSPGEISFIPEGVGREIKIYDIEYSASPVVFSYINRYAYPVIVNRTDGKKLTPQEIQQLKKDSLLEQASTAIYVPGESVTFSTIDHNPSGARFALINSYIAPIYLNAPGINKTTSMLGSVLNDTSKGVVNIDISENKGGSTIRLQSDWIQDEFAARSVLKYISSAAIMKRSLVSAEIFGNPLIEVGDIINTQYILKNMPSYPCAVIGVNHSFNNGINTSVTLRRISNG